MFEKLKSIKYLAFFLKRLLKWLNDYQKVWISFLLIIWLIFAGLKWKYSNSLVLNFLHISPKFNLTCFGILNLGFLNKFPGV